MYFGSEDGTFYALDAPSGKTVWKTQLAGSRSRRRRRSTTAASTSATTPARCTRCDADDGAIVWQTGDLGGGLGQSGRFYSTAAVAFGRVYAGNVDGRVYSFDAVRPARSPGPSRPATTSTRASPPPTRRRTDPTVYFGSHDRYVYALDAKSGKLDLEGAARRPGQRPGDRGRRRRLHLDLQPGTRRSASTSAPAAASSSSTTASTGRSSPTASGSTWSAAPP